MFSILFIVLATIFGSLLLAMGANVLRLKKQESRGDGKPISVAVFRDVDEHLDYQFSEVMQITASPEILSTGLNSTQVISISTAFRAKHNLFRLTALVRFILDGIDYELVIDDTTPVVAKGFHLILGNPEQLKRWLIAQQND